METKLSSAHRSTYAAVFQHPVARNLKWLDVRALLVAVADTVQEHSDVLKVSRQGKSLVVHRPSRNGMQDIGELMKVRHFLEHAPIDLAAPSSKELHLFVVIDHRMARIYQAELQGTVPQRITPYDPSGSSRHLHYVEENPTGQRKPEQKAFYDAIIRAMQGAAQILLFGSGTGASSAMEHLLAELKRTSPELANRVVGSLVVNEQHLTENQLLAKAREFYASRAP